MIWLLASALFVAGIICLIRAFAIYNKANRQWEELQRDYEQYRKDIEALKRDPDALP